MQAAYAIAARALKEDVEHPELQWDEMRGIHNFVVH
jgi:uncharacterized protein with HEPN domain